MRLPRSQPRTVDAHVVQPQAVDLVRPFPSSGSGPWLHTDPHDRPGDVFGGETTLVTGPEHPAYLLLSVIPPR